MSDQDWRALERAWAANMGDAEAEARYLAAWNRAGCPGRDPRRHPVDGDVVQALTTAGRGSNRYDVIRRYMAQHTPPYGVTIRERIEFGETMDRRLLGTVNRHVQFFPAVISDVAECKRHWEDPFVDTVQLRTWRAWALGVGTVIRRMPMHEPPPKPPRVRRAKNPPDERARRLEREAAQSGSPEARARVLLDRVRRGEITPVMLLIAAVVGDPSSELAISQPFVLAGLRSHAEGESPDMHADPAFRFITLLRDGVVHAYMPPSTHRPDHNESVRAQELWETALHIAVTAMREAAGLPTDSSEAPVGWFYRTPGWRWEPPAHVQFSSAVFEEALAEVARKAVIAWATGEWDGLRDWLVYAHTSWSEQHGDDLVVYRARAHGVLEAQQETLNAAIRDGLDMQHGRVTATVLPPDNLTRGQQPTAVRTV